MATEGSKARLRARPGRPAEAVGEGERPLGLDRTRDGWMHVPRNAVDGMVPLAVLLHGAGGDAAQMRFAIPAAEAVGAAVLAPESRGRTWDVILGSYGPDVTFIDRALAHVFSRVAVDVTRIGVGGFSDGASYALSLGLSNGDLFSDVLAFSPGFLAAPARHGQPRIFISHGTHDEVLPIDRTSRRLTPALTRAGYTVTYREFDGPHTVPPTMVDEAFRQLATRRT